MQTSDHYRAKAAEMTRLANEAAGPHMRNHWTGMAAQWNALAPRLEAEQRVMQPELSPSPQG